MSIHLSGIEGSVPLQTEAEYDTIMLVKDATYSEGSRFDSLLEGLNGVVAFTVIG